MTTPPTQNLSIHLLGGFRVSVEERSVHDADWRLRKTKHLVKLLALASGHRLHREHLMETLWPEQSPEAAANNLHKAIYTARRALEPTLSAATPSSYLHLESDVLVLSAPRPVWVDVEVFEQAAAQARVSGDPRAYATALEVYTAELLPEDRYEDWAAGRRETLQALYVALLLEFAQVQEARGQPRAAIEPLSRIVASEPSNEEARVALMRLYAQAGQRHQALRQYQQLCAALRRDLEVEPAPETEQLYQDILAGRAAVAARLQAESPISETTLDARRPDEDEAPVLVGRDAELDILEDAIEALFDGRGRLVFLAGEAGIGKSRLAREIVVRVRRRGGIALIGAAYEQEGRLPYGPFVEALEPVGGLAAPVGLQSVFGDGASDFARLPESQATVRRSERQRLFAAVSDALRRVAVGTPVLLVLDDLHAADRASLELLHYVVRTTRESPVLVLATFRAEEAPPGSVLGQLVGTLRRDGLAVRLDLERLAQPASDLLVSGLVMSGPIDRTIFDTVHQVAEGNPLYTLEILRTLRESGRLQQVDGRWQLKGEGVPPPGAALDMLAARMERLGSAALQVLITAAVIGLESAYPLLRAANGPPDDALLDALDVCLAYGVLRETPDGYRFGHPLQRAAIYERLSRARRRVIHGRVAAALQDLHTGQLEQHAEALAHHWALSERPGRAVSYLIWSGDRAAVVHANEAAEAAYSRALELLDAPEAASNRESTAALLWEKVGDIRALAGAAPGDQEAYAAGVSALQQAATFELEQLVRLHRKAAYAALSRHAVDAATPHLAAAEAALDASTDSVEWPRVRLVRALWFWARGSNDAGQQAAEESAALASERGELLDLINAYMALALVFHSSGRWKEGLALEIEHLGRAADADPGLGLLFDAHMCLGEYHLYGDSSFEVVEGYARQILAQANRTGALRAQAMAWLLLGESLLAQGRWNEAADCLQSSLELQRTVGSPAGQAFALQRLAELDVYRGNSTAADNRLAEALKLNVDSPMAPHVMGRLYATAALNALERGDAQSARQAIEDAADVAPRFGDCSACTALLHPVATDTYLALGDVARADYHAQAAGQVAEHWESGAWLAMAERAQARVLEANGDSARAARRFLGAAEIFERIGMPYDMARCLADAVRTGAPTRDDSRDLLLRALGVFRRLQAEIAGDRTQLQLSRL